MSGAEELNLCRTFRCGESHHEKNFGKCFFEVWFTKKKWMIHKVHHSLMNVYK